MLGMMIIAKNEINERGGGPSEHYTLPRARATADDIAVFEDKWGVRLPADYRQFLLHADGWPRMHFETTLFGLAELRGEGDGLTAPAMVAFHAEHGTLAAEGLTARDVIVIGVHAEHGTLYALIRDGHPRAGQAVRLSMATAWYADFTSLFLALADDAVIRAAERRPRRDLDPGDDWPELTHGQHAYLTKLTYLRAWAQASVLRGISDNGLSLYVARRAARRSPGSHVVLARPDAAGDGLWTLLVIIDGQPRRTLVFPPGATIEHVEVDGQAAVVTFGLDAGLQAYLGQPAPLTVTLPAGHHTRRPAGSPDAVDLREHLAEILLAAGLRSRQLDDLAAMWAVEEAEQAAALAHALRPAAPGPEMELLSEEQNAVLMAELDRCGLGHRFAAIAASARPAVTIRTADPGGPLSAGASRFGGCPDLPPGVAWPAVDGQLRTFLLQLDLAAVPPVPGLPLPDHGVLSFFAGDNATASDPGGLVCHYTGPLHRAPAPPEGTVFLDEEGEVLPERAVTFGSALRLPPYGSDAFDALALGQDETDAYLTVVNRLDGTGAGREVSFLGGYPDDSGHDMISDLVFAAHGRTDERLTPPGELRRKAPGSTTWARRLADWEWWHQHRDQIDAEIGSWTTLLVCDSHSDAGMCWWDAGTLNFLIRHTDLAGGRFDAARVVLSTS